MSEAFIKTLAPFATDYGTKGGILPALIIAQGILESASGTSELAVQANNLFGIKKGTGWDGPTYIKRTAEWDEVLGDFTILAEFRKYDSYEFCVRDLVTFYQKPRYAQVIGERDFLAAATASHAAGYATDPDYPQKLYNIYTKNTLGVYEMADLIVSVEAGHGGFGVTPGKRGPDGKFEWIWNNASVLAFIAHMTTTYNGVRVVRVDDPTGRTDVPLATRVSRSNAAGAHLHISFHMNAMGHAWTDTGLGVETFIATGSSPTSTAARAQDAIHSRYVKAMGLKDRGQKQAPFYILMYTKAPAILLEGGFMDSKIDRKRMDDPTVVDLAAAAAGDGVAELFNLGKKATAPKPSPDVQKWFRVRKSWADIAGQLAAFLDAEEAKELADRSKASGFKVFDNAGNLYYDPNAKPLYRVRKTWADAASQLAALNDLEAAKDLADHNMAAGYEVYNEEGKIVHQPKKVPIPVVKPAPPAPPAQVSDSIDDLVAAAPKSLQPEFRIGLELKLSDGSRPNDPVTRAEALVMNVRTYLKGLENK